MAGNDLKPKIDQICAISEKDKRGEFFVSEMTADTMPLLIKGTYNIHFGAICLKKPYQKTPIFNKLLFSIVEYIEKLAINNVFINGICTQAYSKDGKALAKSLGLKYCVDHKDGHGEVYCGTIRELLERPFLRDFDVLRSLYS